jgi:hypothetical protein
VDAADSVSPNWVKDFRIAPLEWAWRSVTHRKVQPMREAARGGLGRGPWRARPAAGIVGPLTRPSSQPLGAMRRGRCNHVAAAEHSGLRSQASDIEPMGRPASPARLSCCLVVDPYPGGVMTLRTHLLVTALLGSVLAVPRAAVGQEAAPPALYDTTGTAWVYASYFRVPWPRVDSLIKLQRFRPAWRARAVEMGCYLDSQLLIHQTGNEYNVVLSTTYASFRNIGPGSGSGACANGAWRETVPDSTLRAALQQGNNWVFGDAAHYDVIYWIPYPTR